MSFLALNLALAVIWMLLAGGGRGSFAVGFAVGFSVIALCRPFVGGWAYVRALPAALRLALVFALELVGASLRMARDVLRPNPRFEPAFIEVDARDLGPLATVLFAALIALTPGSVTVDIEENGDRLYVHTLYAGDVDRARARFREIAAMIAAASGAGPGRREPWKPR